MDNREGNPEALSTEQMDELQALEQRRNEMLEELIGRRALVKDQTVLTKRRALEESEAKKAELCHDLYPTEKQNHEERTTQRTFPEVVTINVGGQLFTTTVDTMRQESGSMLDTMFSGRHRLSTDRDGNYFIDRDGEIFTYVLSYLRTGSLPEDLSTMTIRRLKVEADFYGLDNLLALLEGGVRQSRPQFAILSYTTGFAPSNFIGATPDGVELVFFQDDCYRSCKDMTEVLTNMKEQGWSLVLNVPPLGGSNGKGRLIFRKEEFSNPFGGSVVPTHEVRTR